ncbi:6911_t:CDS:1, partial [Cetraspora pellucida]
HNNTIEKLLYKITKEREQKIQIEQEYQQNKDQLMEIENEQLDEIRMDSQLEDGKGDKDDEDGKDSEDNKDNEDDEDDKGVRDNNVTRIDNQLDNEDNYNYWIED